MAAEESVWPQWVATAVVWALHWLCLVEVAVQGHGPAVEEVPALKHLCLVEVGEQEHDWVAEAVLRTVADL